MQTKEDTTTSKRTN